jgi:hypothetical protein
MSLTKTQKCIGVIAAVAVMGSMVAKADIGSTINNAKSGTTVTVSGTYSVAEEVKVPASVTVKGPATFNFTTGSKTTAGLYLTSSGAKIQSITVTGANHAIDIQASSCSVSSCVTHDNYNDGIICENSAAKSDSISGCTSYNNVDSESGGGNADGFGCKQGTGTGITFSSCTSYNNSDDGFDFEKAGNPVVVTGCTAYSNGAAKGYTGNGNGFKMGYKSNNIAHSYTSCVAHNNTAGDSPHGFSTNNSTAKIHLTSCHSYSNGKADVLGNCVLSNCTMQN